MSQNIAQKLLKIINKWKPWIDIGANPLSDHLNSSGICLQSQRTEDYATKKSKIVSWGDSSDTKANLRRWDNCMQAWEQNRH